MAFGRSLVSSVGGHLQADDEIRRQTDVEDWTAVSYLEELRHQCRIEGQLVPKECWRMKDRMKTVSVALVLCLNIEVDPPDILKTKPCARMETWIDPRTTTKPMDHIASNLQQQYQRWQPKARYKHAVDPTTEEVKKLCSSLRRNAKDDRILFHYNGHGVPRPTQNGEIWVFNKNYSQYIPLPIYELQAWMGSPSIYVFDCSAAGQIVSYFTVLSSQQRHHMEFVPADGAGAAASSNRCILGACGPREVLPQHPALPADLFTCCLTTPVKMALRWFVLNPRGRLVPDIVLEDLDRIPGLLTDRRTMLGELNWIFTSITDTIAWNTLPRGVFQRMFRQDLLVASLFRNFLLAERIMKSYDCNPVSLPALPSTYQHGMWATWDLAVDACLLQLSAVVSKPSNKPFYLQSVFFEEELTAFQVWLQFGADIHKPPEQLPIVLQVLLSQAHRVRALDLLSRFLDLGPWAVNQALSVGIFPYVLKLLQASARELRPLLVIIWAKIMALDPSCQIDLVRDNGHRYFLEVLADPSMPPEHRTMAAFVLAAMVRRHQAGQLVALQGGLVLHCVEQMEDSHDQLRAWLAIALGHLWLHNDKARWAAVRELAHEKLFTLLEDRVPEVRTAAVYALSTFMNAVLERTEHADSVDHTVMMTLLKLVLNDGSPMVRRELVSAFSSFVQQFERKFISLAAQDQQSHDPSDPYQTVTGVEVSGSASPRDSMKRVSSTSSLTNISQATTSVKTWGGLATHMSLSFGSVYWKVWNSIGWLASDPDPITANLVRKLTTQIKNKVSLQNGSQPGQFQQLRGSSSLHGSPAHGSGSSGQSPYSPPRPSSVSLTSHDTSDDSSAATNCYKEIPLKTGFIDWMEGFYAQPLNLFSECAETSTDDDKVYSKECRFAENFRVRCESRSERRRLLPRSVSTAQQLTLCRLPAAPTQLAFCHFTAQLVVADKNRFSVWDYERGVKAVQHVNHSQSPSATRITSLQLINPHYRPLLAVGSSDGTVRVWSDVESCGSSTSGTSSDITSPPRTPGRVTSWLAVESARSARSPPGLQMTWSQVTGHLVTGSEARTLAVWDLCREQCVSQISTNSDAAVTTLSSHNSAPHLAVSGHSNGSVRVYDTRLGGTSGAAQVGVWREHQAYVVASQLRNIGGATCSLTGDQRGVVKVWDARKPNSTHSFSTVADAISMSFHPEADIMACGSVKQQVSLFTLKGAEVDTVRCQDGFMNQRTGPVSCLTLHPVRIVVAAASTDGLLSVHRMSGSPAATDS